MQRRTYKRICNLPRCVVHVCLFSLPKVHVQSHESCLGMDLRFLGSDSESSLYNSLPEERTDYRPHFRHMLARQPRVLLDSVKQKLAIGGRGCAVIANDDHGSCAILETTEETMFTEVVDGRGPGRQTQQVPIGEVVFPVAQGRFLGRTSIVKVCAVDELVHLQ